MTVRSPATAPQRPGPGKGVSAKSLLQQRALLRAALAAGAMLALAGAAAAADPPASPADAAASAPVLAPVSTLVPPPAAVPAAASGAAASTERLQVTDPYLELRTGPGRGFPVFFVAERSEWVVIELRHTDWYKVRTANDKLGWVHRSQLETTLTEAGGKKTFRDLVLDDYLTRRVQLGAAWGRFKHEPMLKMWTSYKLSDTLTVEGTLGQVQGVFSGTDFWHLNLQSEPWSDSRLSPFFGIGFGKFKNIPNTSLVGNFTTNAKLGNATVGARFYLTDRFVLRADYSIYTAFLSDAKSSEYRAITAGLSFFF